MAKHCLVRRVKGPVGFIGCAHCGKTNTKPWEPPDPELERTLALRSQAAHRKHCRGFECH